MRQSSAGTALPGVAALVGVLLEKGILTADELREAVEGIESWGAGAPRAT